MKDSEALLACCSWVFSFQLRPILYYPCPPLGFPFAACPPPLYHPVPSPPMDGRAKEQEPPRRRPWRSMIQVWLCRFHEDPHGFISPPQKKYGGVQSWSNKLKQFLMLQPIPPQKNGVQPMKRISLAPQPATEAETDTARMSLLCLPLLRLLRCLSSKSW